MISLQIVPTIIDLLIESNSLSANGTNAAKDIRGLYEGQSLIRPLYQEANGMQDWQFSVMNTGGSWLAVRSANRPAWRIVIPLIDDVEWRFTDVERDPQEEHPITSFSFYDLMDALWHEYGDDKKKHKGDDDDDNDLDERDAFAFPHPPPPPPPPHHPHPPPPPPPPHHPHHRPGDGHGPPPPPPPPVTISPSHPRPDRKSVV